MNRGRHKQEEYGNTYYWIAQNSWGENFCDNGFFKVEFGQVKLVKIVK